MAEVQAGESRWGRRSPSSIAQGTRVVFWDRGGRLAVGGVGVNLFWWDERGVYVRHEEDIFTRRRPKQAVSEDITWL